MDKSVIVEVTKKHVEALFEKVDKKILSYHNWKHTMNVFNAAILIADNTEGVGDEDRQNLQLAALFHDVGYLDSPKEHEARSAVVAKEFLNARDYPALNIKEVERLILATKLKHQPQDILEKIIIDADLSHLGREDYIDTTYKFLSNEIAKNTDQKLTDKDWAESCMAFLSAHQFLTQFAKKHFGKNKENNLEEVRLLIQEKKKEKMENTESKPEKKKI